jgi:hypothetical protein
MKQLQGRLKKLEDQYALRNGCSLDTLSRKAREMVRYAGLIYEDAATETVGELDAASLDLVIAEAVSQYGKEIVGCERA